MTKIFLMIANNEYKIMCFRDEISEWNACIGDELNESNINVERIANLAMKIKENQVLIKATEKQINDLKCLQ